MDKIVVTMFGNGIALKLPICSIGRKEVVMFGLIASSEDVFSSADHIGPMGKWIKPALGDKFMQFI